jgi:starch synthase
MNATRDSITSFKVLFAVTEANPIIKVGGLGDVAGSLPRILRLNGHDVRLIMPRYGIINLEGYDATPRGSFGVAFMGQEEVITVTEILLKHGTPVYLLGNSRYFDRTSVYGDVDDLERFLLFSMAVLELPRLIDWLPDILHCHDWHTGAIPAALNTSLRNDKVYSSCASVFTIHNLGYQGWFDGNFAQRANLSHYLPPADDPMHEKTYSMMALGIYHGTFISTVSETYAREILTPEYGMSLELLLQRRQGNLMGILNGLDYGQYNPGKDPAIVAHYTSYLPDRRVRNKIALLEKAGLPVRVDTPLMSMVGRVVWQKGFDIAIEAIRNLLAEGDVYFILQGTGESWYEEQLRSLEAQYPGKCRMFLVLDFSLAGLIFSGCDMLIVPSRYEPCGLSVPIAMRYGAIPITRRTGGLAEMVTDCSPDLSSGLGFVFEDYDVSSLIAAIQRALGAFNNKEGWRGLIARAMKADFSWETSAIKYEKLYNLAKQRRMQSNYSDEMSLSNAGL